MNCQNIYNYPYVRISSVIALFFLVISCQLRIFDPSTVKAERDRFIYEKKPFIDSVFLKLPGTTNETLYKGAFWASELMQVHHKKGLTNLRFILAHFSKYSEDFRRTALQDINTLYPNDFLKETDSLIWKEPDSKLFAMMASYLIKKGKTAKDIYINLMKTTFPNWKEDPILKAFLIENSEKPKLTRMQLQDLIDFRKEKKEPTIFVFIHNNRELPGEVLIMNQKGEFLREQKDTQKINVLARSVTNLPEFITNGNTPQGVYSMQGIGQSDNKFIGQSPTVITALPFEVSLQDFSFGQIKNEEWSLKDYCKFFPDSWNGYPAKEMAYYAGQAGRSEIIIHGTTINPEYYKGKSYYPYTPSLGCLCALEIWNEKDGSLIKSEQLRLIETLKKNKIEKALVYVVEI